MSGSAPAIDLGPRATRTRDAILSAARAEFLDHGYVGTRVHHITSACGISRAGFYLYFRDKRQVFDAVGEAAYHAVLAVIGEWDALAVPATAPDVEAWTRSYFAVMDEHGSFIFSSAQAPAPDEEFRQASNRLQMRVAWSFGAKLQRRQQVPTDTPDALGLAVLAMLDRTWFASRAAQLPVADADLVRTVARCIAAILGAR